jgi:hypothetical protein
MTHKQEGEVEDTAGGVKDTLETGAATTKKGLGRVAHALNPMTYLSSQQEEKVDEAAADASSGAKKAAESAKEGAADAFDATKAALVE